MAKETIASMAVRLGVDLTDFQKDMTEFQKTWGKLGKQIQDAGTKIGITFTAAGSAIAAGLGVAVSKAMDFDAEMSRVGAIAGATGSDLEDMRQTALDLGASTSKSASEVATGMELMAAKGYDATQTIAAMPGVIAAAEASGEDMAMVADTVASALNAFGMEAKDASKVADVLAKSANTSAAGVEDLQYAFKYAAPVANSLGISMEQLAAATGIMADSGMKGEQAGTTLRAALLKLTDPSKEAKKGMDALGLSVTDAQGNFLPFDQIIQQLATSTANMTNAQKSQALSTIFGTEAMTGMLSLVEAGPEKLQALTTELQNSGGASATAAAAMKDNLKGSMDELSGAVETLQISMGSALAPAIQSVADGISGLVHWFNDLSPTTQKWIAIGAALAAGLLVLVGVIGFMAAALGAMAAAEWAVILPIAGIVAGVALVIAAIAAAAILIYQYWDEIVAYLTGVWEGIKQTAATVWDAIKQFFVDYWPVILGVFTGGLGLVVALLVKNWDSIWATIKKVWGNIKSFFSDTWGGIKTMASDAFGSIATALENVWDSVTGTVKGVWSGIESIIKGSINWIIGAINKFIGGVNSIKIEVPSIDIPFVGKVGGFSVGLPNIPKIPALATGTNYVPADTLAYIHKGEAVVPKEYNPANGGGANGGPTTLIIEMDGRAIAQKTFERMGGTLRMRGAVT
ncbi:phage tail tape measure protein [Cohnella lubricantis]|uniref:Phage tail tape measure protein n=1 Tax=Cohnella lubricantis TaxID=2163172 RepID=A0A841TAB5_9BACL|nr:phage tail tape measure protein [Cohnella lubricantis]MBB6675977.1 phage tail tape measure protein [Cohnella lubricantis]MBP2117904.1 TP901 family phage tail tape measure protein [Cohnella lubricantis]